MFHLKSAINDLEKDIQKICFHYSAFQTLFFTPPMTEDKHEELHSLHGFARANDTANMYKLLNSQENVNARDLHKRYSALRVKRDLIPCSIELLCIWRHMKETSKRLEFSSSSKRIFTYQPSTTLVPFTLL